METAITDWRGDERLVATAEALRRTCGHPPREAHHWQEMWNQWGTEGDRWIRMARAAIAAYTHEHRYPRPNGQGFPVDQCLDCLEWRSEYGRSDNLQAHLEESDRIIFGRGENGRSDHA